MKTLLILDCYGHGARPMKCSTENALVEHVAARIFGEGVIVEDEINKAWADLPENEPTIDQAGDYRSGWPRESEYLVYLTLHGKEYFRGKARASIRATLEWLSGQAKTATIDITNEPKNIPPDIWTFLKGELQEDFRDLLTGYLDAMLSAALEDIEERAG